LTDVTSPAHNERPDQPLRRLAGTCHNAPASARHDRNDSYQKTKRLAAWFGAFAPNREMNHVYKPKPPRPRGRCCYPACHSPSLPPLNASSPLTKRLWEMGDIVDVLEAWEKSGGQHRE
jgi:hypothetical protein